MKRLAAALDEARRSRSRLAKEAAIGRALVVIAEAGDDVALATAARLAAGRALAVGDGRSLGVGWRLVAESAMAHLALSPDIFALCVRTCGDMGEAFGLLLAGVPGATERPGVPLADVATLLNDLADMGSRVAKRRRLDETFARATPLEAKYLTKALLGELRIGAQGGVLEAAIARGFAIDPAEIRRAAALVTDPGELAVLAARGRLGDAHVKVGRPVAYMLATPMENVAIPIDPAAFVVEDKIDGVRAQVHKRGGDVWIYARGLDEVTGAFPEVAAAFRFARGDVALDGELMATLPDGRPRPFMALQNRLGRVAPSPELVKDVPVAFVAYDFLVDGDEELLGLPWTARRARLEQFARERGPREAFVLNGAAPLSDGAVLDARFEEARARGHEGLVLKRADAPYDAGRRGQAWIKVKKAYATLDVVVTAVEEGHGRRAGVLSDYTFGVWKDGTIVNVGKAYSGLTDEEIDQMQRRFEKMTVERFGSVRAVRPEIVIEVAFDGIQRSTRHKSGFALRFPRIMRVRDDKTAEEADRLDAVLALYNAQIASGHREDRAPEGKEARPRRVDTRKESSQLSLFTSPNEGTHDDARVDTSVRGRTRPRRRS